MTMAQKGGTVKSMDDPVFGGSKLAGTANKGAGGMKPSGSGEAPAPRAAQKGMMHRGNGNNSGSRTKTGKPGRAMSKGRD